MDDKPGLNALRKDSPNRLRAVFGKTSGLRAEKNGFVIAREWSDRGNLNKSIFDFKCLNCYHSLMKLEELKQKITPILREAGVQYAGVFGSVARGEAGPDSDVDILVKFSGMPTFAAYLKLDDDLRQELGREVDLITEGGMNKLLRPYIERDLEVIYGQR